MLALVALLTSACGGTAQPRVTEFVSGPGVVSQIAPTDRTSLPPVTGSLLGGGTFDSADYPGSVLVYNVWGSWCGPCREEAPALQAVWEETRERGVQFVGVNVKDNDAAAQAFEREFSITYPSIRTADSPAVLLAFRSSLPPGAVPSTLIVDREGRVATRIVGATTRDRLSDLIDQVLTERP